MTQSKSPEFSVQGSGDFVNDYQLYIRTAAVEQAWPEIPGWPLASRLGPLLVSFEITLKILKDALEEVSTRLFLNSGQKCEAIALCLNLQLRLMTRFASRKAPGGPPRQDTGADPIPGELFGPISRESGWRDVMQSLERMHDGERLCAELKLRYESLVQALGFDLGLNEREGLDYDRWVRPAQVHGLYQPDRRAKYPEDALFVRVHQVCEGLLEVMHLELREAEQALYSVDYLGAESHVLMAARFARSLDSSLNLLGEMSQSDYASLRLAQKNAGITQSPRWQAGKSIVKDHFWLYRQQLTNHGLDPFLVLVDQGEHVVEHRLLQAFKLLSRSMQESLSNHAHLMQNIQGAAATGNVDPDAPTREQPDAPPPLPELTGAFDLLTLWTSLKHTRHSGAVIRELEEQQGLAGKYGYELPTEPCIRSRMLKAIDRYFSSLKEGDREVWIALFIDPPYFENPKGARPSVSRQDLDMRFRNFRSLFPRIDSCEYQILAEGENFLQLQWTVAGESFLDGIAASSVRDQIFYFDPEGRIHGTIVEWDPESLAEQLIEQHREAMLDNIGTLG